MRQVPAYICDKCGYYSFDRSDVAKHESIPLKGSSPSLDGLIAKAYDHYTVFRKSSYVDKKHTVLYTWDCFDKKSLIKEGSNLPAGLEKSLQRVIRSFGGGIGFTAGHIFDSVLLNQHHGDYPNDAELSEKDFARVTKILKSRYPELYKDLDFRRTTKKGYLRPS